MEGVLPNGGFGCAFCVNLEQGNCVLRDALITKDHWTVCADVQYRVNTFGLPAGDIGPESAVPGQTGSIFSITSSEGAYIQVPWLGNQEFFESQVGSEKCSRCDRQIEKFHSIFALGQWYYFCTFRDYLLWRNEKISQGLVDDDEYAPEKIEKHFKDFTELEVIAAVSSEESRRKANQIEFRRILAKRTGIAVLLLGLLGLVSYWPGLLR